MAKHEDHETVARVASIKSAIFRTVGANGFSVSP
jgi:hypothetical protein